MLLNYNQFSNGKGVSNIGRPLAMSHKSCKFNFWKPMPNFSQFLAKTFRQSIKVPTPNLRQSSSFAKVFESSSHKKKSGRFFFHEKVKKEMTGQKRKKNSARAFDPELGHSRNFLSKIFIIFWLDFGWATPEFWRTGIQKLRTWIQRMKLYIVHCCRQLKNS